MSDQMTPGPDGRLNPQGADQRIIELEKQRERLARELASLQQEYSHLLQEQGVEGPAPDTAPTMPIYKPSPVDNAQPTQRISRSELSAALGASEHPAAAPIPQAEPMPSGASEAHTPPAAQPLPWSAERPSARPAAPRPITSFSLDDLTLPADLLEMLEDASPLPAQPLPQPAAQAPVQPVMEPSIQPMAHAPSAPAMMEQPEQASSEDEPAHEYYVNAPAPRPSRHRSGAQQPTQEYAEPMTQVSPPLPPQAPAMPQETVVAPSLFDSDAPRSNRVHPSLSRSMSAPPPKIIASERPSSTWSEKPDRAPSPLAFLRRQSSADQPADMTPEPENDAAILPLTRPIPAESARQKPRRRLSAPLIIGLAVSLVLVVVLAFGGYQMSRASQDTYPNQLSLMGLPWDHASIIDVGGMKRDEVLTQLVSMRDDFLHTPRISVTVGSLTKMLTPAELGLYQRTDELLADIDEQLAVDSLLTRTLFRTKFEMGPRQILGFIWQCDTTEITSTALRLVDEVQASASAASITGFDPTTQELLVTAGSGSVYIDANDLAEQLLACVKNFAFDTPITIEGEMRTADQEVFALRARIGVLAEQTVISPELPIWSKSNLAAIVAQLDGTLISAGQSFSMMDALAGVPAWHASPIEGEWIDAHPGADLAATALFNAAVRAGLETTRQNADVPPTYIELGLDATLGDGADLVIHNPSNQAVVLRIVALENGVTARIDGVPLLDEGVTVSFDIRVVEQLPAVTEPEYKIDTMAEGTAEVTARAAVDGQTVQVNIIKLQSGVSIDNQPLGTLTYPSKGPLILRSAQS